MTRGHWVHLAEFQRHNGTVDEAGNPTLTSDHHWEAVLSYWPCSHDTTSGGEGARGRQMVAEEKSVLHGDPHSLSATGVDTTCRVKVSGTMFEIESISGTDALSLEATVVLGKQL